MSFKLHLGALAFTGALALAGLPAGMAQDAQDVAARFDPSAIVEARQGLKAQVAVMRSEIELAVEFSEEDAFEYLRGNLGAIAASVEAFPYLFPSTTSPDALSAAGSGVSTSASAAIWDDFEAFEGFAQSVAQMARQASEAESFAQLAEASATLWGNCTACHDAYLVYDPFAAMGDMDLDFDSPFF